MSNYYTPPSMYVQEEKIYTAAGPQLSLSSCPSVALSLHQPSPVKEAKVLIKKAI